ncbi:hypothetical protein [Sinisalibacter lacisalsi]|uniref:Cytochrome c domain-containing protein n=1 Tax=Sinisalibacter lacisalsi TaxID=1526570 RepID=A0ABQ1QBE0_9RHOB|nr:hypothetical protein [Sinisalibacter lacisalsi]GGD21983.1 hypothetical protein GCM10011358_03080 [Sinisalibacter lacisalsi]
MAQLRRNILTRLAATWFGVAASSFVTVETAQAEALVASPSRTLAAELRVARGDLARLEENNLPEAHRTGLEERIAGALGLLPWLLIQAGDPEGARRLTEHSPDDLAALTVALDAIIERHAFDLAEQGTAHVRATALLEARAIHDSYCAGCHDDTGDGDPEMELPIRDLFGMARAEPGEVFAARLYVGVKGDETIGFRNPLTETQFQALWRYYSND